MVSPYTEISKIHDKNSCNGEFILILQQVITEHLSEVFKIPLDTCQWKDVLLVCFGSNECTLPRHQKYIVVKYYTPPLHFSMCINGKSLLPPNVTTCNVHVQQIYGNSLHLVEMENLHYHPMSHWRMYVARSHKDLRVLYRATPCY